jgi:hypothetical protein
MGGLNPTVIRYALLFVAALVGFAMAGGLGIGLGIGLVYLGQALWLRFQNAGRPQAEHTDAGTAWKPGPGAPYKATRRARITGWTFISLAVLFMFYALVLGLLRDSAAAVEWMRLFLPAVEVFSTFIPALHRMPLDFAERGQTDWARAVQHVLLLGWLFWLVISPWIVLEVLVVNRHSCSRARSIMTRRRWSTMILMASALLAPSVYILFSGPTSPSARTSFGSLIGLPMLAGSFFCVMGAFFMLVLSCNVLLTWPRTDSGRVQG